ncbi:AAA family ATPase [Isoptericola nanjingensis]|uniref:AAA family ATPase n=1 Tax=Isoptericola nanjingensis TaxID=903413 RepID=UPI003D259DB8
MVSPQLNRARVHGLFGYLDHEIEFTAGLPFVILYGANGVGKTTVLKMLNAVYENKFEDLMEIPFGALELEFSDGAKVFAIGRSSEQDGTLSQVQVHMVRRPGEKPVFWEMHRRSAMTPRLRKWLQTETSWRPIERRLWQDVSDGETLTETELVEMFGDIVGQSDTGDRNEPQPKALELFLNTMSSQYIGTDRLTIDRGSRAARNRTTQRVNYHSQDLRRQIHRAVTREANLSHELDRTFPMRLLADSDEFLSTEAEVRHKYNEQNSHRARLRQIGLISNMPEMQLPPGEIDPWKLKAMSLFLQDAEKRISTYDSVLPRFSLFHEMINSRFVGKKIQITSRGLEIEIERTGRHLEPAMLSSGEQHELIMTYELIFKSQAGQLILIDEPELSLHSVWQQHFFDDLQRILRLTGSRAMVATHSPQIVDRWTEAMVPLHPGVKNA